MGLQSELRADTGVLVITIISPPDRDEGDEARALIHSLVDQRRLHAVVLDLSLQQSSILTAARARAFLSRTDRQIARHMPDRTGPFRIAIVSRPGSFGHGMGRMLAGHAYDLAQVQLEQFETLPEAETWAAGA
ncbi:hypothetical protein GCM10011360_26180 [Primorskyibacter flagellatus]|uniref:Uncharacterized protein n=1 Tax=Primorskyibacter flagellatus TaxID=1387277 RepID=A0A917AAQ6_9RHOB|nr:hypothetical protein [Primorskyibacter flagellatus]GGE37142.1 hypothetical protein GCM10011360_26180 [Primorskyibacter flagellatus]